MLKDKNILIGITGGIAVYKVAEVVSRLKKLGANVDIIMTKSATEFVNPLTFQTLARSKVHLDMFENLSYYDIEHISLGEKADIVLVAPASANTIGKISQGIADDLLTTTIMATRAKVVFAPAMNSNMYLNPIVQRNMANLKDLGYEFIDPGSGFLACNVIGVGRMAEPIDIVEYLEYKLGNKDLLGKKFLVSAGPTIEPIDPVRYITNHSSGKMGYAIAKQAALRGANVVLISGPTNLQAPKGVELIDIKTTEEMFQAVERHFYTCDVLIKSAAPLDYKNSTISSEKIKKGEDKIILELEKNPDILKYFGNKKTKQVLVGFAAETHNLIENAKEKVTNKKLDFIVANNVLADKAGFKGDTNIVTIIDKLDNVIEHPLLTKDEVANIILDKILEIAKVK